MWKLRTISNKMKLSKWKFTLHERKKNKTNMYKGKLKDMGRKYISESKGSGVAMTPWYLSWATLSFWGTKRPRTQSRCNPGAASANPIMYSQGRHGGQKTENCWPILKFNYAEWQCNPNPWVGPFKSCAGLGSVEEVLWGTLAPLPGRGG